MAFGPRSGVWRRLASPVLVSYVPILFFLLVAAAFAAFALSLPKLLAPRSPNRRKLDTYECGEIALGEARGPLPVQYYLYVLVFLILDIEAVFLIPWALEFRSLGAVAAVEMFVFVGLLLVGWLYAWKKGALEWVSA